jgi:hypothetical protein
MGGKHGTVHSGSAGGMSYIKNATVTGAVRIVARQSPIKQIVTCDKAVYEATAPKAPEVIHLTGNVRVETTSPQLETPLITQSSQGVIRRDGTRWNIVLKDVDMSGTIADPSARPEKKKP